MKIKVKYHIECGEEIIECESLEQAERKINICPKLKDILSKQKWMMRK